jgi:hypothetical protein
MVKMKVLLTLTSLSCTTLSSKIVLIIFSSATLRSVGAFDCGGAGGEGSVIGRGWIHAI